MTSSLVPEQHVLQLQSLETVACNIPGVHLHNCRVHFVILLPKSTPIDTNHSYPIIKLQDANDH